MRTRSGTGSKGNSELADSPSLWRPITEGAHNWRSHFFAWSWRACRQGASWHFTNVVSINRKVTTFSQVFPKLLHVELEVTSSIPSETVALDQWECLVQNHSCWDASRILRLPKQRQVKADWYQLLCFGSPTVQFASQPSMCDFVPSEWIVQRAYSLQVNFNRKGDPFSSITSQ